LVSSSARGSCCCFASGTRTARVHGHGLAEEAAGHELIVGPDLNR
jgi:hypothetical protein